MFILLCVNLAFRTEIVVIKAETSDKITVLPKALEINIYFGSAEAQGKNTDPSKQSNIAITVLHVAVQNGAFRTAFKQKQNTAWRELYCCRKLGPLYLRFKEDISLLSKVSNPSRQSGVPPITALHLENFE